MEILSIAIYLALFDLIGWKIFILICIQCTHQYLIIPNLEAMRNYIDNTTSMSFIESICVLCIGNILMVQYIWITMQQSLEQIKHNLTHFYVIKLLEKRLIKLEEGYQHFKQQYYFQTKATVVTSMISHLSEIDTSISPVSINNNVNDKTLKPMMNIEQLFVKQK